MYGVHHTIGRNLTASSQGPLSFLISVNTGMLRRLALSHCACQISWPMKNDPQWNAERAKCPGFLGVIWETGIWISDLKCRGNQTWNRDVGLWTDSWTKS